jgi:hypothetical protein
MYIVYTAFTILIMHYDAHGANSGNAQEATTSVKQCHKASVLYSICCIAAKSKAVYTVQPYEAIGAQRKSVG